MASVWLMNQASVLNMDIGKVTVTVVLGLLLAGYIDYISGIELRVYPLYFLPICLAAWRFETRGVAMTIIASTTIWAGSNVAAGLQYSTPYILLINAMMQLVTFSIVGTLLRYSRVLLDEEKMLSSTDRMTGLFNSRGFYPLVQQAAAICKREQRPLTLAYIDLDNFKCVNDRFGHQRGDQLLHDVAGILKNALRASDIVARLGGDEFAVCLPETDRAQAAPVLERLRETLSRAFPEGECNVSASIGAVCWNTPPDEIDLMVSAADEVMYRVKAAGKNRVEITSASAS